MIIACYCRVSTEKESQTDSMENQKEFFLEYANKNSYKIYKIYADEGISGTKLKNRVQFLKLLEDAHQHKFDMVVVKDVSRFARNTVDLLQSIRALKVLNINVDFITANMTTLGDSEFILTLFGALAQEESSNISKRIKFAKNMNAEKGRVPNQVYGYDKVIGDYFNLYINEKESEIVKNIYEMYVNQGIGENKISMILNEKGLRTKKGYQWSQNAIARILQNQIYIGKIINKKEEVKDFLTGERIKNDENKWAVIDKPELSIIDETIFNQAQLIRERNRKKYKLTSERNTSKYIFSTLIKCKCCGKSFRRLERMYKNKYIRWTCSGRNKNGSGYCENKINIDENELLDAIKEYFAETLKSQHNITEYIKSEYKKKNNFSTSILSEKKKELTKLKRMKQKYIDMFKNDVINIKELKENTSQISDSIREMEILISNMEKENSMPSLDTEIKDTFSIINELVNGEEITNELLKSLIDLIEVDIDGNVDVKLKILTKI